MANQKAEFYIGLFILIVELLISYSMWFAASQPDIKVPVSASAIVFSASLFVIYFVGYLISHDFLAGLRIKNKIIFGVVLSTIATLGLSLFFFFGMVGLMSTMIVIQLASIYGRTLTITLAILFPAFCVLLDILLGKTFDYTAMVIYGTFNTLALVASYKIISEQKEKKKSQQLNRELTATQILLGAASKRDERLRIARDLHDSMGHQLTALSLQLEVANHVKDAEKQNYIKHAREISSMILSDLRGIVSEFRETKNSELHQALVKLTEDIPNLETNLIFELDSSKINSSQAETIFRCVQEAVTNCIKHGNASQLKIKLYNDDSYVNLTLSDNGNSCGDVKLGNGLAGMNERVRNINGTVDFSNNAEGFCLFVRFPEH